MKCACCNLTYIGVAAVRPSGKREFYYRCNGNQGARGLYGAHGERCPSKAVRGEWLEEMVWNDVLEFLRKPSVVIERLQARMRDEASDTTKNRDRLRRLRALLEGKADERAKVVGLYRRGRLNDSWWLLALCCIFEGIVSVIYFIMYDTGPAGPLTSQGWISMVVLLGRLALAAGACTIAAGIWKCAKRKSWLLVLNGLALGAYGLIPLLSRGPLSFDLFALLVVVMAVTFGILALAIAQTLRRDLVDEWFFGLAGAGSIGFALAFLALVNRWIQLERRPFHPSVFLWLCFYFGFSAVCMLGLALRLHRLGPSQPARWEDLSPLGNQKPHIDQGGIAPRIATDNTP
jgi:uncharacterized membrane protein HdeD (DUF308 family)